ncbi:MAG: cytochrome c3 family protein [Candidatus Riflebacteria bacterium]|nr:cytochrome c3 family protein [Candidatus Riflebacteria bacterium]
MIRRDAVINSSEIPKGRDRFPDPIFKICIGSALLLMLLVSARSPASNASSIGSATATSAHSPSDTPDEIMILESPRMKWIGVGSTAIRFNHTSHQKSAEMRCTFCHERIAQKHPDPNLSAEMAHGVCRQCHIPQGLASAHMGCNDCHRPRKEATGIDK